MKYCQRCGQRMKEDGIICPHCNAKNLPYDVDKAVTHIKSRDKYCSGCMYDQASSGSDSCNYLIATGKIRPCPPGKGCTVRAVGGRKYPYRCYPEEGR